MSEHAHKEIPPAKLKKRGKVMSEHAHSQHWQLEKREGKSHVPEHALKKTPGSFHEHAQT